MEFRNVTYKIDLKSNNGISLGEKLSLTIRRFLIEILKSFYGSNTNIVDPKKSWDNCRGHGYKELLMIA